MKAVSEIYSPVSIEVTEVNASLANSPEKINQDPHGAAWLIKGRATNPGDLAKLMDAKAYEAFVAEKEKEAGA